MLIILSLRRHVIALVFTIYTIMVRRKSIALERAAQVFEGDDNIMAQALLCMSWINAK